MTYQHSFLLLIALFVQHSLIKGLQKRQWFQQIYNLSPQQHQLKPPTPAFGGVGVLISILIGVVWFQVVSKEIIWCLGTMMSFSVLGFLDDIISLRSGKNKGLSVKQKFVGQWGIAIISTVLFHMYIAALHPFWVLVSILAFVSTTNATNLTDGVDGLLGGVFLVSLWGMSVVYSYLGLPNVYIEFLKIIGISCVGFLWFNWNPAKIFMGDTGSLGLGALLVALSMVSGHVWILIPLGVVYIIETVSVMVQVYWFKKTGKRVLLMSPLHHHFEMLGWSEKQIVGLFMSIQLFACIIFWLLVTIR